MKNFFLNRWSITLVVLYLLWSGYQFYIMQTCEGGGFLPCSMGPFILIVGVPGFLFSIAGAYKQVPPDFLTAASIALNILLFAVVGGALHALWAWIRSRRRAV